MVLQGGSQPCDLRNMLTKISNYFCWAGPVCSAHEHVSTTGNYLEGSLLVVVPLILASYSALNLAHRNPQTWARIPHQPCLCMIGEVCQSLLTHDLWVQYTFRTDFCALIVRCWELKYRIAWSMKSCSARCHSCVVVDIVIGIGREDSTKNLHGNDNTTFLIEADDGICKISWYCPQTRVGDVQSTSMHGIYQAFHSSIGIDFDGYIYYKWILTGTDMARYTRRIGGPVLHWII